MPEFCLPLAFRSPVLCKAPLMVMVELGGETIPFVVTTRTATRSGLESENQDWLAPGDVEIRRYGCFGLHPDFQGETSMHCSDQGELHADVSKCEDLVFNGTRGSIGLPGLAPALEGLTLGACRRRCLLLRGECQGFEFARRRIKTDEDDVAIFSHSESQDTGEERTFCTLHASKELSEIKASLPTETVWVYRLVGTPSRWPEIQSETPQASSEDGSNGPIPVILGVVAALVFSCSVLFVLRRYCNLASWLEEPEPPKSQLVNPGRPLKCAYCGRGFNTYPALTVHQRRCEAEFQEAERVRKESQRSLVTRSMELLRRPVEWLGGSISVSNKSYARKTEPTVVQVGSP